MRLTGGSDSLYTKMAFKLNWYHCGTEGVSWTRGTEAYCGHIVRLQLFVSEQMRWSALASSSFFSCKQGLATKEVEYQHITTSQRMTSLLPRFQRHPTALPHITPPLIHPTPLPSPPPTPTPQISPAAPSPPALMWRPTSTTASSPPSRARTPSTTPSNTYPAPHPREASGQVPPPALEPPPAAPQFPPPPSAQI